MTIDVRRITRTGMFVIVFGVGGALLWGGTAPLNGAVVINGMVKGLNPTWCWTFFLHFSFYPDFPSLVESP